MSLFDQKTPWLYIFLSPPTGPASPPPASVERGDLPPLAPSSPPHIARLGSQRPYASGDDDDVPRQIMHNRNRARSTSISKMSDSYFQEFVAPDPGDGNSSSASLSCSTHSDGRRQRSRRPQDGDNG